MDGTDKYGQESQRANEYEPTGSDDNGNGTKPGRNEDGSRESGSQFENGTGYNIKIIDGKYCRPDGSVITTGWESERAILFTDKQSEGYDFGNQKETSASADWNSYSRPRVISDNLYFIGNLFEMIDNQTKKPHKKHARLSQKEKEKKLAHGQKIDDVGWEQSM